MANPSLTDINNQILPVIVDNYLQTILTHLTPNTDPYMPYIGVGTWDPMRGLSQTQVRATGELPTAMPGAGTALAQNDGSGNVDLSATTIAFGRTTRAYALAGWAFQTETFQVSDFQHDFQALDFIQAYEAILMKYQRQHITDWKRENLVGNTDRKISVKGTGANAYEEVSNQTARFGGLDALYAEKPTTPVNWGVLQTLYNLLLREGAQDYAVGTDQLGNPVFPLILGPTAAASLFRDTESIATPINYSGDTGALLTPYGTKRAVRGFMPVIDHEIPRFEDNYEDDGFDNIYPWENTTNSTNPTGSGRRYRKNANYEPVAAGGQAQYELFYIPTRALMEMHIRPPQSTSYSQMVFKAQNYAGDLQWINNPDMGNNKLGDKGFFYMQNFCAAKPGKTDMGYVGLGTVIS